MAGTARRADGTRLDAVPIEANGAGDDEEYVPKTEFGRRLMEIRRRIVASGQPPLNWDEIEREVAERRGGAYGRDDR